MGIAQPPRSGAPAPPPLVNWSGAPAPLPLVNWSGAPAAPPLVNWSGAPAAASYKNVAPLRWPFCLQILHCSRLWIEQLAYFCFGYPLKTNFHKINGKSFSNKKYFPTPCTKCLENVSYKCLIQIIFTSNESNWKNNNFIHNICKANFCIAMKVILS